MVPDELFESNRKVVGLSPHHEDIDYQSQMLNVRISCRWRPIIDQQLLDELEKWTAPPAAAPTFFLIGKVLLEGSIK